MKLTDSSERQGPGRLLSGLDEDMPRSTRHDGTSPAATHSTILAGDPSTLPSRFLRWWAERDHSDSLWPAFDQLLREMLLDVIDAKRVRIFHVVEGGQALRPLTDEAGTSANLSAPTGLMRHAISVGRRYIRGDLNHGPLVDRLAGETEDAAGPLPAPQHAPISMAKGPAAWVFPIRDHKAGLSPQNDGPSNRSIGLVVVGDLDEPHLANHDLLDALADLVTGFWLHVRDHECLQIVRRTDRGSGVLNRVDFLRMAETSIAEARHDGEPVALLAVALEGLRRFDDEGLWSLRDRVIQEAGRALRRKLRTGDLVGRFSDDRFVLLLRWLDLSLGRLIGMRVIDWVQEAIGDAIRGSSADSWAPGSSTAPGLPPSDDSPFRVNVRCGLACDYRVDVPESPEHLAWGETPPASRVRPAGLKELLRGALSASAKARRLNETLCTADLSPGADSPLSEGIGSRPAEKSS
ncbi:MAG TPA: GGDEF domain-containing protein [Phycisphaerae bacterium]|nr:GGDEF domain-containing protein [Phycisphaerae bacterium]